MILSLPVSPARPADPRDTVDTLLAEHGAVRILWLTIRAAIRHLTRPRPPSIDMLDPKLRRDLGLPPVERSPDIRMPLISMMVLSGR